MRSWDSVYLWDNSANAYVDLEFASADLVGAAVSLMGETTDKLYVGLDRTFGSMYVELDTVGSYNDTPDYEYWNGSAWKNLPMQKTYAFGADGIADWRIPADWGTTLLAGIENTTTALKTEDTTGGTAKYWVRINCSTVTTVATLKHSFPFPSYNYTTPTIISSFLQLRQAFSTTTAPSIAEVETIIRRHESRIERYSTNSWRPNYRHQELYEFSRYGIVLKRSPVIKLLELAIFNGTDFVALTEGRSLDYFVDKIPGIIPFARLYSVPFTYHLHTWGFGEFKRAVRVSYVWGRDEDDDVASGMVEDITTKLVSADIISNYDYTTMIPQGTDRFSLDQKVAQWRESADERLEELRSVRVWVP